MLLLITLHYILYIRLSIQFTPRFVEIQIFSLRFNSSLSWPLRDLDLLAARVNSQARISIYFWNLNFKWFSTDFSFDVIKHLLVTSKSHLA